MPLRAHSCCQNMNFIKKRAKIRIVNIQKIGWQGSINDFFARKGKWGAQTMHFFLPLLLRMD